MQAILNLLNRFADWLLIYSQKDRNITYDEYKHLVKERNKLPRKFHD